MAIKIGGKLRNVQDPKGTIADASQIKLNNKNLSVSDVLEIKTLDTADLNTFLDEGKYEIATAENYPSGAGSKGILSNIVLPSGAVHQVWESSGSRAFRDGIIRTIGDEIDASSFLEGEWTVISETPEIDLSNYATKDYVEASHSRYTFNSIDDAEAAILSGDLVLGDRVSIHYGASEDGLYKEDYKLYLIVKDSEGTLVLKELSGGASTEVTGSVKLNVEALYVDDKNILGESTYEAKIGSTIKFEYTFESEQYPDVRGTVYVKKGSEIVYNQKIYPNGDLNTVVYNTSSLTPGTYTFTIYGVESTGKQTERTQFRFLIGGLNVTSTFNEEKVLKIGEDLLIPISVTAADQTSAITAKVSCDDKIILERNISVGSSTLTIPAEQLTIGIHNIKVWLENSLGKKSNELSYNITLAAEGVIYTILDNSEYVSAEGARVDIIARIIQLGYEEGKFSGNLRIVDKNGLEVRNSNYSLSYGLNLISLVNLKFDSTDSEYTEYRAELTISPIDTENTADSVVTEFLIKITKNDYNIKTLGDDNLECCFLASGKTNNSADREIWTDASGKNVKATFNNFNWTTNGWLQDEDGETALMLNSGAYVELDISPFAKELNAGESMTFSIDFSTKDILDSEAKVISCLQEYDGDESQIYYLRDNFGDYVEKGDSNIINYFKNIGGYCYIDGETYLADGTTEYKTTMKVSDRTINYNLGDENPNYDGKTNFRKFTGSTRTTVKKQKGLYIDTQYAVLSHSGSLSNVMNKFYLNFTENTRTRIDFIITRSTESPYYFASMIGYVNGVLSLMKAITSEESFAQTNTAGHKYKIYLGCKGTVKENGSVSISQTGSANIYSFRIYNRALTPGEILNNYAAEIPNLEKKKAVIDNNDILNKGTIAQLPQICLIGYESQTYANTINKFIMQLSNTSEDAISDLKKMKEPAYLTYTDVTNTANSWTMTDKDGNETNVIPIRLQFQGTSSMVYPVKNYKFKMYTGINESVPGSVKYEGKYKRDIGNGKSESTFCLKAD